jgi:hypothetical protein
VLSAKEYEVASLSCIFLAVRIAGSNEVLLSELLEMSRGGINTQDIIRTGTEMIQTLSWEYRIIAPTEFAKNLIDISKITDQNLVLDAASYLLELSVLDVVLSHSKACCLAIAAVMNALETSSQSQLERFRDTVRKVTSIDCQSPEIMDLRRRLSEIHSRATYEDQVAASARPHVIENDEDDSAVPQPHTESISSSNNSTFCKRGLAVIAEDEPPNPKRIKTIFG